MEVEEELGQMQGVMKALEARANRLMEAEARAHADAEQARRRSEELAAEGYLLRRAVRLRTWVAGVLALSCVAGMVALVLGMARGW